MPTAISPRPRTVFPGPGYQTYYLNLSEADLALITDFTDLRLRVTAGFSVAVPCCPDRFFPEILQVTVSDRTGGATCLPDSFPLLRARGRLEGELDGLGVALVSGEPELHAIQRGLAVVSLVDQKRGVEVA